jgi:hypothetical protein
VATPLTSYHAAGTLWLAGVSTISAGHARDATRYALHGELGEAAKTEAYLAEMQRQLAAMGQY